MKLHVPWHILLKYAERMKLKMPLKVEKDEDEQEHDPADDSCCDCSCFGRLKKKLMYPFKLHNDLINETVMLKIRLFASFPKSIKNK